MKKMLFVLSMVLLMPSATQAAAPAADAPASTWLSWLKSGKPTREKVLRARQYVRSQWGCMTGRVQCSPQKKYALRALATAVTAAAAAGIGYGVKELYARDALSPDLTIGEFNKVIASVDRVSEGFGQKDDALRFLALIYGGLKYELIAFASSVERADSLSKGPQSGVQEAVDALISAIDSVRQPERKTLEPLKSLASAFYGNVNGSHSEQWKQVKKELERLRDSLAPVSGDATS